MKMRSLWTMGACRPPGPGPPLNSDRSERVGPHLPAHSSKERENTKEIPNQIWKNMIIPIKTRSLWTSELWAGWLGWLGWLALASHGTPWDSMGPMGPMVRVCVRACVRVCMCVCLKIQNWTLILKIQTSILKISILILIIQSWSFKIQNLILKSQHLTSKVA